MTTAVHPTADSAPESFWEQTAVKRWGAYISEAEARFIRHAHEMSEQPSSALEIGVDAGRWSELLADLGWQMTCTDIDPETLAVCQKRIPNAMCIRVNPTSVEFPCETDFAQLVMAIEVPELVNKDWFIEEVDRVLKPGGMLVGVFLNRCSWRGVLKQLFPLSGDSMGLYTAAYSPWRNKLIHRGFKIVHEEGLCWMPFGRQSDSPLIPAAVTAERLFGLRRLTSLSPWIVFTAKKNS